MSRTFEGFSDQTLQYLRGLQKHNNRDWFHEHKPEHEQYILEPSKAFVEAIAPLIMSISPHIYAEPKVNRSLFRISRDTRFSKNKTPYKTHVAMIFWEGGGKRMDCSSFYVHFDREKLMLGAGMYCFSQPVMEKYRELVAFGKHGEELPKILQSIKKKGYEIGGEHYKRIPRGYDKESRNAELLLHNGLYAWHEEPLPKEFHSEKLVPYIIKHFKKMAPLHAWLVEVDKRTEKK